MTNPTTKNRLGELFPAGLSNVDGLFEHFFGAAKPGSWPDGWAAPASIWEEENELHVEIDAPGVAKADVEITFDKSELDITIARKRPEERRFVHNERGHGRVTRTVALPDSVDPDSLEASLADGVLHVKVSKRPDAQPKRIELK